MTSFFQPTARNQDTRSSLSLPSLFINIFCPSQNMHLCHITHTTQNKRNAGYEAPLVQVGDGFNDTVNSQAQDGLGVGGQMVFTDAALGVDTATVDGNQASFVLGLGLSQGFAELKGHCTKSASQTTGCQRLTGKMSFYTGFPLSKTPDDMSFEAAYGTVRGNYSSVEGRRNITGSYLWVDKPWLIAPSVPHGEQPSPGALTVVGSTSMYGNLYVEGSTAYIVATTKIDGTLDVTKATKIGGTLDVDQATTLKETLLVKGKITGNAANRNISRDW